VAKWALTTRRLWARLGLRDNVEPEVIYAVQPTYIVGDGSALVPPTLPAIGWSGGTFLDAANFHALEVHSRAPGGCFIREISFGGSGVQRWGFTIAALPATFVAGGTLSPQRDMGPIAVQSTVRFGGVAVKTLGATHPHRPQIGNDAAMISDLVYIPAGSLFYMEAVALSANTTYFSVCISDVAESIPGSPT